MNIVIGSGPAGVAAAVALLERGVAVTMLDAGGRVEAPLREQAAALGGRPPETWAPSERAALRGPLRYNSEGVPLKLAFGSDFVYRDVDRLQPVRAHGVDAYRAFAAGGLSVLWGAAMLPFSAFDLEGWPIAESDLSGHYRSVLELTGHAVTTADATDGATFDAHTTPLPMSAQAQAVFACADAHRQALSSQGLHISGARLAVAQTRGECRRCGMCLHGCPYGLIYSAAQTLDARLRPSSRFRYEPDVIVRRVEERPDGVRVHAEDRATRAPRVFDGKRVFLGAGTFATTSILLASLGGAGVPVTFRQSDHFLLPMLLRRSAGPVEQEALHTLSQLFIGVTDPAITLRGVHLQLYTYNDHYARMAADRLGLIYHLCRPLAGAVIERFMLLKGYLHSEESAGIRGVLRAQDDPTLELEAVANPRTGMTVRRVAALLAANTGRLGAWPVRPALRQGLPGSGIHVGGSFPMRARPVRWESDVLGRPAGLTRVHVVDATVFPSLPAAPPTLTIMANARRIAAGADLAEGVA